MTACPPFAPAPLAPLTDDEVRALGDGALVVRDGLLGRGLALACAVAVEALDSLDVLTPAAVGRERRHDPRVRADRTTWLDPARGVAPSGPLAAAEAAFEGLRLALNTGAWLGLQRFELQLARYPGDGLGYVRHRDALPGDRNRVITAILYLNPDWCPAHGGRLRAWVPDGPVDVDPILDRLVVFRADAVHHAVLPAHAPRRAITAWFRSGEPLPGIANL